MVKIDYILDWLTIIAFILSTYTFVIQLITHRKKIHIELSHMFKWGASPTLYVANLEIINCSRLPISIIGMSLNQGEVEIEFARLPQCLARKTNKQGKEILSYEKVYSDSFPVVLQGLEGKSGLFLAREKSNKQLIPQLPMQFRLITNRGPVCVKSSFNDFSDHKELLI